jgi:hypothetical protein
VRSSVTEEMEQGYVRSRFETKYRGAAVSSSRCKGSEVDQGQRFTKVRVYEE